jgi:triacylglycerol lipase
MNRALISLILMASGCTAVPAAEGELTYELAAHPTRYPLVLVHGMAASPTYHGFRQEVVQALCRDGHRVFVPILPPFASSESRARAIGAFLDEALAGRTADACGAAAPAERVSLIAHSMGGLDARYLVSRLGYGDRVAAVVTISSPHRGSAVADLALGLLGGVDDRALDDFARWLGRVIDGDQIDRDTDFHATFIDLAEANAPSFNDATLDDPRVRYESWAGLSNVLGIPNPKDEEACEGKLQAFPDPGSRNAMHIALQGAALAVAHGAELRPNDGLVTVASAKWGAFRGCLPADHADEVHAFPFSFTPFDHVLFYRQRAAELAATGL